MNIGSAIKKIRLKKNIKQVTLAKESGISVSYLSEIENGKKNPDVRIINQISDALSIPVSFLYFAAFEKNELNIVEKRIFIQNLKLVVSVNPFFLDFLNQYFSTRIKKNENFIEPLGHWDIREY
ncbi:MAG: helix-turn-helix domain-containing protein [Saprospiraceae bacterium]